MRDFEPHDHIAAAHPGKVGSPFQSDRDFRQKRRRAETLSVWMAARWIAAWVIVIWAVQFLPW